MTSTAMPKDVAKLRMRTQRITSTSFDQPEEVVAWLGAVQAQDYLGALWGVGLRLRRGVEGDVERALAEGRIVRTWPLRGTLHFVAAADARWILELLGARVLSRAAGRLRTFGVDRPTLARARAILARELRDGKSLTRAAAYAALERGKVPTQSQRGLHILWHLAHERFLCFGPRAGKQQTFVLFDEWIPASRRRTCEEARAELACRYFRGHGPATVADFAWWSGLGKTEARTAVRDASRELLEERIGDETYWRIRGTRGEPSSRPRARAYLLPAFDEFLVGYADRSAALDQAHAARVNDGGGILNPTMVIDGRVVGTWKRALAGRRVTFAPSPFAPLDRSARRALDEALARYRRFLGAE
ncbi:MAG TPA: winged helix DNA-binding domain-containing protein [Polyangiaceae bacterium]